MKRLITTALAFGLVAGLGGVTVKRGHPRVITLYAQSVPVTKTLAWDANPPADAVTNYTVTLDGTTVGQPTTPTQSVTFTTTGAHTLTVTATNIWGTSPATTLIVNVKIPGAPTNPKIQ